MALFAIGKQGIQNGGVGEINQHVGFALVVKDGGEDRKALMTGRDKIHAGADLTVFTLCDESGDGMPHLSAASAQNNFRFHLIHPSGSGKSFKSSHVSS